MDTLSELVQAAKAGTAGAFERIVARFRVHAQAVALQWVRDHEAAQDVVQEVFTEVYLNLPSLREPAAFVPWFDRILVKHCDRYTRSRGAATVTVPVGDWVLEPARMAATTPGSVHEALLGLPAHQRVPLALYVAGYSHAEIAALLHLPLTTVKKRFVGELHRDTEQMVGTGMGRYAVTTIPVGLHPGGVAVNPVTRRLYVASAAVGQRAGSSIRSLARWSAPWPWTVARATSLSIWRGTSCT